MSQRQKIWLAVFLSAAIILISYTIGYQLADSWLERREAQKTEAFR